MSNTIMMLILAGLSKSFADTDEKRQDADYFVASTDIPAALMGASCIPIDNCIKVYLKSGKRFLITIEEEAPIR